MAASEINANAKQNRTRKKKWKMENGKHINQQQLIEFHVGDSQQFYRFWTLHRIGHTLISRHTHEIEIFGISVYQCSSFFLLILPYEKKLGALNPLDVAHLFYQKQRMAIYTQFCAFSKILLNIRECVNLWVNSLC